MSLPTGNYVELELSWNDWLQVRAQLESVGLTSAKKAARVDGDVAMLEVPKHIWRAVSDSLRASNTGHNYIDRGVSNARWSQFP